MSFIPPPKDSPAFMVHHGTCNYCEKRITLIGHFNYNEPEIRKHFQLCKNCLEMGLYGINKGVEYHEKKKLKGVREK